MNQGSGSEVVVAKQGFSGSNPTKSTLKQNMTQFNNNEACQECICSAGCKWLGIIIA
jgi:hypothetical protein